jgi:hypothetical protein
LSFYRQPCGRGAGRRQLFADAKCQTGEEQRTETFIGGP